MVENFTLLNSLAVKEMISSDLRFINSDEVGRMVAIAVLALRALRLSDTLPLFLLSPLEEDELLELPLSLAAIWGWAEHDVFFGFHGPPNGCRDCFQHGFVVHVVHRQLKGFRRRLPAARAIIFDPFEPLRIVAFTLVNAQRKKLTLFSLLVRLGLKLFLGQHDSQGVPQGGPLQVCFFCPKNVFLRSTCSPKVSQHRNP